MRKLYHEYFYIPKDGKIREKVMLARVATTVLIVVLCLAAMGFTAYAYFSADLTSGSNTLTAAKFDIAVSIVETETGAPVSINASTAKLMADKTYEVTLCHNGTAKTGYAVITVDTSADAYYTTQLVKGEKEEITFSITPDVDTKVTFLACWGTSSYYIASVQQGETYENAFFIKNEGEIVLTTQADGEPVVEEPADAAGDEKEPSSEPSEPSAPAENVTSEPSKPAGPMESTASEPAESAAPEPTEPEKPAAPEVSEPVASTGPTGPETSSTEPDAEPTESESSGDGSIEQTGSETESSEGMDAPIDGSIDEPIVDPGE